MIVTEAVCSWQEASPIMMEKNHKVHRALIPHLNYSRTNSSRCPFKVCLLKSQVQMPASAVMQKLQFVAQSNCNEVPLQLLSIFSMPSSPCWIIVKNWMKICRKQQWFKSHKRHLAGFTGVATCWSNSEESCLTPGRIWAPLHSYYFCKAEHCQVASLHSCWVGKGCI